VIINELCQKLLVPHANELIDDLAFVKSKDSGHGSNLIFGGDISRLINIDFDFFDPDEIDFIALKRLLAQLFQADTELLAIHELAELIISQNHIGTTVKTDGKESDPYAVLTVLNFQVHAEHPAIKTLSQYLLDRSTDNPALKAHLSQLLAPQAPHVGLIVSERLINMPVQVMPPMYRMLSEEMQRAISENKPYQFSHFVIVTRTYMLSPEDEAELASNPPPKKAKQSNAKPLLGNASGTGGIFSFHPEDECIQKFASHTHDFRFTRAQPREKDAFGLDVRARMMVVPSENFTQMVQTMQAEFGVDQMETDQ